MLVTSYMKFKQLLQLPSSKCCSYTILKIYILERKILFFADMQKKRKN